MANRCQADVTQAIQRQRQGIRPTLDTPGPEYVQAKFRDEFYDGIKPSLEKLHESVTFRLGPVNLSAEEERDYRDIITFNATPQNSWSLCMELPTYGSELAKLGQTLKNAQ